jgi:CYTH domain-containing protein
MEIERKFLVKILPDLTNIKPEIWERYFLELGKIEKRISKIDAKYFYEVKTDVNKLMIEKEIREISKNEFDELKKKAIKNLKRKSFLISDKPKISIKIYENEYEGLIRAEFEFESENEAKIFESPEWVGKEITKTELSRDGKLIKLKREEFLKLLKVCTYS